MMLTGAVLYRLFKPKEELPLLTPKGFVWLTVGVAAFVVLCFIQWRLRQ